MKKSLSFLLFVWSCCLLNVCGCGSSAPPPPPQAIIVGISPNAAQALDVNQSVPIAANVSNDSSNQGVNWTITCPAGVTTCGAMAQSKTPSGTQNKFAAPANVGAAEKVTVTATSVSDSTKFATVQVTVNPALALVNPPPVQQQVATAGAPFSLNLMNFVQGGTAPFTWSITSGALPAGLTLNATTGMISGTPSTAAAAASIFTLSCTDSGNPPVPLSGTLELSLTINAPGALAITSGAPPSGTVNTSYGGTHSISGHSFTGFPLTATGGTSSYTWSWAAAQGSLLPPGLNLSLLYISGGTTRCCVYVLAITGTPTTAGTYNVVVTVTDSASPPAHVSANYTINIAAPAPLSINSAAPPSGTVGVKYGPSSTEDLRCIWTPYRGWHMVCNPCPSPSACSSLPPCNGNVYQSPCRSTQKAFLGFLFSAIGGLPPYTWALASTSPPPPGLKLSTSGFLAGTPTTPGTYNITVTVSDSASPPAQGSASYQIVIAPPPPPVINAVPPLPIGTQGSPYVGFTFTAASGAPPLTWSETGALPQGMSFSAIGVLSGTPSAVGTFSITVTAQDIYGQDSAPLACTIQILAKGFSPTGSLAESRVLHVAALLSSGKVLVTGGVNNTAFPTTAELYDPTAGTFAPTKGSMATSRVSATATVLQSGKVLVIGGKQPDGNPVATAEIYDPVSDSFTPTAGSMQSTRVHHTATLLNDGTVLVTGGLDVSGNLSGVPVATAELFDPVTSSFTPVANMVAGRFLHAATLLASGKVLVTGGLEGSALATAELFDPISKSFSLTAANMSVGRAGHTATLIGGGKVLVAGGAASFAGASASTAEVFDPATGTFSAPAAMITARSFHTATLLTNGQVLLAGGDAFFFDGAKAVSLSAAELYDPGTGSFAPTADMTAAREAHTATLLGNGQVLVVGGANGTLGYSTTTIVLDTAELYQ